VLYPSVAYGSVPTLSTSDQQLFTFGADANGYAIAPMGKVGIYTDLGSIPTCPWREGQDFIRAGATAIRIPNNNTYTGTLYWVGITPPADIDASHQPTLFPEASRVLIAIRAAYDFGTEGNRNPDLSAQMAVRYGEPLSGNKGQFAHWLTTWRTQYRSGGVLGGYTGLDLALGQQWMPAI
jgi:hypothetical protein